MKKQKKSNLLHQANGITLIALVISIIVMLILAGVSINAIVGENGILTRTQYATFLNEMATVEEAVEMWKAGEAIDNQGETTAIPTNGLCKANDLASAERLTGEVGYYRVWSMSETQPEMNILIGASEFNIAYSAELVTYPAGVQDLYYLNNEACGIDSKKTYLIDAATGMVYSMTGINLKGISCYSSNMAKAVMNGDTTAPNFAAAEVSGTGSGEKLAGNVQNEFLYDENGNLLYEADGTTPKKNPDYNPNGFKIIATTAYNNVYKLYNNGDLYGKGQKGMQLNTSVEEMNKINYLKWNELIIPENLKNYKEIIVDNNMFIIDQNNDLWAIGPNTYNIFGLTQEQQVEYTGREWIKLNVSGKKVKKVFNSSNSTFVITIDNELYVAGRNDRGQLGIGNTQSSLPYFSKVNFEKVSQIKNIKTESGGSNRVRTIIMCEDNTFYFTGVNNYDVIGNGVTSQVETSFIQIWDGNNGPDIDQDIVEYIIDEGILVLLNDGTVWCCGYTGYYAQKTLPNFLGTFKQVDIHHVESMLQVNGTTAIFKYLDGGETEYWLTTGNGSTAVGSNNRNSFKQLTFPDNIKEKIVEIYATENNVFILLNDGTVYGSGSYNGLGLDVSSGFTSDFEKLSIDNVKTLMPDKVLFNARKRNLIVLESNDGKFYSTNRNFSVMYQNDVIQSSWTKIASNVLYFEGIRNSTGCCYVDRNNNVWVAGTNSSILGLGDQMAENSNVPNFVMIEDENIKGKAVEAQIANNLIGVKLKDGSLWTSGYYEEQGYPGWSEEENKKNFFKILDNVTDWSIFDRIRTAISNGELYGWGTNFGGSTGVGTKSSNIPVKGSDLPFDVNSIANLEIDTWTRTHIITKSGELFQTGNNTNGSYDGGHSVTSYYSQYTHNLNFEEGEVVKDYIRGGVSIVLTNKGNVYGFGAENRLGINSTSSNDTEMRKLPITDVEQITVGTGFVIAVKKDGTVWGTGSNIYGILGRWIGTNRKSPNSRYRTAFEWVECPELEI